MTASGVSHDENYVEYLVTFGNIVPKYSFTDDDVVTQCHQDLLPP